MDLFKSLAYLLTLVGSAGAMTAAGCGGSGGDSGADGQPFGGVGGVAAGGVSGMGQGGLIGGGAGGQGGAGGGFGGFGGTGGMGAGGGPIMDACAGIREETETGRAPVDIIVAVDTSGSMDLEAGWTQAAMPGLVAAIQNSGIDVHLVMISGCDITVPGPLGSGQACPNDTNMPNFLHVNQGVGSNNALDVIINTFSQWQPMMRPNALKSFLVVTDDNSNSNAGTFTNAVNGLDPNLFSPGNWVFNAIFSFAGLLGPGPCAFISAAEGTVYRDLTIQTMGIGGDLCSQNFQPIFDQVATSTVTRSPLACEWDIPMTGMQIDPALVNVVFTGGGTQKTLGFVSDSSQCATVLDGWYYDDNINPTKVFACPDTCTNTIRGSNALSIEVQFGCATEIAIPK